MMIIGLMSGTSADGTDAALVRVEGTPPTLRWEVLAHGEFPHPPELRGEILACCDPATGTVDRICALHVRLGHAFADAAVALLGQVGQAAGRVDLVGSHGQTVWHSPSGPWPATLQLGAAAVIAERSGLPVVSNFRMRDMAVGGQGAPLVAYVDQLLLAHQSKVRAAQNIGGIANVTYLPPVGHAGACAFDTGPGNMLIDDAVGRMTAGALTFDRDGEIAAEGRVAEGLLERLLDHPYLTQRPPKTTGRELFGAQFGAEIWQRAQDDGISPADLVATLTAFTAHSIARAYSELLPSFPDEVIVSGGGAANSTLMGHLRHLLAPAEVITSDALGLPSGAKEAVAFALLAYETWHRRPGNLPAATGARRAVVLGDITY